jgi:hypothetical protein
MYLHRNIVLGVLFEEAGSGAVQLDEKAIIAVRWKEVMEETVGNCSSVLFRLVRLRKP